MDGAGAECGGCLYPPRKLLGWASGEWKPIPPQVYMGWKQYVWVNQVSIRKFGLTSTQWTEIGYYPWTAIWLHDFEEVPDGERVAVEIAAMLAIAVGLLFALRTGGPTQPGRAENKA